MINKSPAPGDYTEWLVSGLGSMSNHPVPNLHDSPHYRISALLAPDGEPLLVPIPRPQIGFDLRKKGDRP